MNRVWFLKKIWWCECGARSVFRNILTKSRKDTPRRQKVPETSKNFETLGKNVPLGIIICRLANTRCEPIFLFSQEQQKVLTKAWQLRKFYFTQKSKILLCIAHAKMWEIVKKITKGKNKTSKIVKKIIFKRLDNLLPLWYYNCRKRK